MHRSFFARIVQTALPQKRADQAKARSGSGLGLAIAKWIAEIHDGTIEARKAFPAGTCVTVCLPDS